MKNPDTKQWPERPVKRTPGDKSEEKGATGQGTKRLEIEGQG